MGLVDYHTHTYLCGHATGSPDEYIKSAISKNLSEIGFSDHAPLPDELRNGISMHKDETEFYIGLIEQKREFYKNEIKVKIGFEVDYPFFNTFNNKYFTDPRLDYLIGSCHFIGNWSFDNPSEIEEWSRRDIDKVYSDYYKLLEGLIGAAAFNILGHFDLVKKFGHRSKKKFNTVITKIAKACSKNNLTVELNTAGLRKPVNEIYPSDEIIAIMFRENVPVTLGSDAHTPEEIAYEYDTALKKLKKNGYKKISGFSKKNRYDIQI